MIDQKRNQRLWQACGWKLNNPDAPKYLRIYLDPTGELVPLPTPSDPVPFIGYLLRDTVPVVLNKLGGATFHINRCGKQWYAGFTKGEEKK